MMRVHVTAACEKLVKQHRLEGKISALQQQLVAVPLRKLFNPIGSYWRRKEGEFRILGTTRQSDREVVLCLVHVFRADDVDYKQFLEDPDAQELDRSIDEAALRALLKKTPVKDGFTKGRLPPEMLPWLEPPAWRSNLKAGDCFVYETEEWVSRFKEREIQDYWVRFHELVYDLLDGRELGTEIGELPGVRVANKQNVFIAFSLGERRDRWHQDNMRQIFLLIYPSIGDPATDMLTRAYESICRRLKGGEGITHDEAPADITRYARRSYPGYLVYDELSWLAIQREEEANLALSPEEEEVLELVSGRIPDQPTLPVFIKGRAGSAKSTLLYYLFADYCYRKAKDKPRGELLFVTYNEKLVERARESVRRLLHSHHRFLEAERNQDWIPPVEAFFKPLGDFLLGMLPLELRETRFSDNRKRMDFSAFKARYEATFAGSQLSAELCWYVIKTFIKGYDSQDYVTPEGYQEVPRKERTVSAKTFHEVYATAWKWYLNLMGEGYWDEEDLVRELLQLPDLPQEFAVIFCDEAQDLTRLELQLLMNVSCFQTYDLGLQPIRSLPYAFAGDPFQTLNPMGFQWSIVQSTFFQEVLLAIDPHGRLQLRMNPQSLNNNYRSSPGIVRVSNLILLWRHVLLSHPDLAPQFAWRAEDGLEPLRFVIGDNISEINLSDLLGDTIIIVPCEEGQESQFVKQDRVLSELFSQNSLGEPPKNVLSAAAAKGLEFKRVVVYHFGEKCPSSIWDQISYDEEAPIQKEYFFNKLYVAVSRATHYLYIIDTARGDEQLWSNAEQVGIDRIASQSRNPQAWIENTQSIPRGGQADAGGIREENPINNADQLRMKGLAAQDIGLLRRAKQFYAGANRSRDAESCEAAALRIEGHFHRASALFEKIGDLAAARDCLLEGALWKELVAWSERHSGYQDDVVALARFWTSRSDDLGRILEFTNFVGRRVERSDDKDALSLQLILSAAELTRRIQLLKDDSLPATQWLALADALADLSPDQIFKAASTAALCFYRAKAYKRAADLWEKANDTQRLEYCLSKSFTHPDRRPYWLEMAAKYDPKTYDTILELWEAAGGLQRATDRQWARAVDSAIEKTDRYRVLVAQFDALDALEGLAPNWLKMIGIGLERSGRYLDASRVWTHYGDVDQALGCLKFAKIIDTAEPETLAQLDELGGKLMQAGRWVDALSLIDGLPVTYVDQKLKMRRRCNTLKYFASSEVYPHTLESDARAKLRDAIRTVISTPLSDWSEWLGIPEVGTALEKMGEFGDATSWFQSHMDSSDASIRSLCRKRWRFLRKREAEDQHRRGRADLEQLVLEDIKKKEELWKRQSAQRSVGPQWSGVKLRGLPKGIAAEVDPDGFVAFRLGDIDVKISDAERKILISHSLTWKRLIVDFSVNRISGDAEIEPRDITRGDRTFDASALGCSGTLVRGSNRSALELEIRDSPGIVVIEWIANERAEGLD